MDADLCDGGTEPPDSPGHGSGSSSGGWEGATCSSEWPSAREASMSPETAA